MPYQSKLANRNCMWGERRNFNIFLETGIDWWKRILLKTRRLFPGGKRERQPSCSGCLIFYGVPDWKEQRESGISFRFIFQCLMKSFRKVTLPEDFLRNSPIIIMLIKRKIVNI